MKLSEIIEKLLFSDSFEDKLVKFNVSEVHIDDISKYKVPEIPTRPSHLNFSEEQIKFPRKVSFVEKCQRAKALHFFANHELLAIEMLASSIILVAKNNRDDQFTKSVLGTILDEQKHLKLYINRMQDLGLNFGDLPLNNFFWKHFKKVNSRDEVMSLVSLTFEQANLDFAKYYMQVFKDYNDIETARIMNIVLEDEISHVAKGKYWLNKGRGAQEFWDYFVSNLPINITPARAKGMVFDQESREKAGLDPKFISMMKSYRDDFNVVNRKQW